MKCQPNPERGGLDCWPFVWYILLSGIFCICFPNQVFICEQAVLRSSCIVAGLQTAHGLCSAAWSWFVSLPVRPSCTPLLTPPFSEQCKHTAPEECWTLWPHGKHSAVVHSVQLGRAVLGKRERTSSSALAHFFLLLLLPPPPLCSSLATSVCQFGLHSLSLSFSLCLLIHHQARPLLTPSHRL